MVDEEIKNNIFRYRKESKKSQEYVAEKLHISLNSYRKIEKGKTQLISSRINEIAEALGIRPEKLLLGDAGEYLDDIKELAALNREYARTIEELREKHAAEIEEKNSRIRLLEEMLRDKSTLIELLRQKSEKK